MSKSRPLDLSGFASVRTDGDPGTPDRRISVPPPTPQITNVNRSSGTQSPSAETPLASTPDSVDLKSRDDPLEKPPDILAKEEYRSHLEVRREAKPRATNPSVRLSVSVPADMRRWLVETARDVGVVQADLLAAALAKHESEVKGQFQGNARWRRGSVPNLTVLGLYLQPVTAERLEQLALDTGAKRSDLVTRVLALAMEEEAASTLRPSASHVPYST